MSIWFRPITLEDCHRLDQGLHGKGTLMQTLGIQITEIGEDYL
ncbi:MAG: thioesterase, partial [Shewanella sp.]